MLRLIVFRSLNLQLIETMLKADNTFVMVKCFLLQSDTAFTTFPYLEVYDQWGLNELRIDRFYLHIRKF